jgi:hypothetical protein
MRLCGNSVDPGAATRMDVAIADFVHSHLLPFSIGSDAKLHQIIKIARQLAPTYNPPNRNDISGKLLNSLYESNWNKQMQSLMSEAKIFGITVFGDGATIKTCPLINILAAGVNNPFALLDVADCSDHCSSGRKKDASYIAWLVDPLVKKMENEVDGHNKKLDGVVDLVFFDGASNVQNAGRILAALHPRISVGHGAEHVVSLFFSDVFTKTSQYTLLSNFCKTCRNIWGATRHAPAAMFKSHSKTHNKGKNIGFIKPSECRMAGEHISLLRLLRLKPALQSTITSPEFKALKEFESVSGVLMQEVFWKYLLVMCRALYAPMRVLRLADQKTASMDKLYYYVLQSDRMLQKWLKDAEDHATHLLTDATWEVIETVGAPQVDDGSDTDDNNEEDEEGGGNDSEDSGGEDEPDDMDEDEELMPMSIGQVFVSVATFILFAACCSPFSLSAGIISTRRCGRGTA